MRTFSKPSLPGKNRVKLEFSFSSNFLSEGEPEVFTHCIKQQLFVSYIAYYQLHQTTFVRLLYRLQILH